MEREVEVVLGADDYVNATFRNAAEREYVSLFVAYYEDQTKGSGIHSPEICLPVGGWEVFSLEPYEVDLADTGYGTFELNRAVMLLDCVRKREKLKKDKLDVMKALYELR